MTTPKQNRQHIKTAISVMTEILDDMDVLNLDARKKVEEAVEGLKAVQEDQQYERAARDVLRWWADGLRMTDDGDDFKRLVRDGMQRISNMDHMLNPEMIPAGTVIIHEVDDESMQAEIRLTNRVKHAGPGQHFLYLGVTEALANEGPAEGMTKQ